MDFIRFDKKWIFKFTGIYFRHGYANTLQCSLQVLQKGVHGIQEMGAMSEL